MLFKNLLKRQDPMPVKAGAGSSARVAKTANLADNITPERRRFPRPMPLLEVVEHDWAVWVNHTQENVSDKPD